MISRPSIAILLVLVFLSPLALADRLPGTTGPIRGFVEGMAGAEAISPARSILLCWSEKDHPEGVHDYAGFAQTYAERLDVIDGVTAEPVEGFPSAEQWERADLVVFYLTIKSLTEEQLGLIDDHLAKGRSIMVVHQALVQREGYAEWADRIGYAFSWGEDDRSKWAKGTLEITMDNDHEITDDLAQSHTMEDELYWRLAEGDRGTVRVLGSTIAPEDRKGVQDEGRWPVFWTVEHPLEAGADRGGRVFCSVVGHEDAAQSEDLFFQLVIFRAIDWCLGETLPLAIASE